MAHLIAQGTSREAEATSRAIRYFWARMPRMEYAAARRAGLPIGSGNVEATCKSLVTVRMKRPGARWKHTTGDEVMQLRALQLSDRCAAAVQRARKAAAWLDVTI